MIKNETIMKWCNDFEDYIFKSEQIQTFHVHELLNEFLALKAQNPNSDYLVESIKNELLKRDSGIEFFNGNINEYTARLNQLFSAEVDNLKVDSVFEAFEKNIIKSTFNEDDKSSVNSVVPEDSTILYDLGIADWEYVSQYFNNRIRGHYIQEAMAWVVTFIESNDYDVNDLVEKNENGDVVQKKTFENIIEAINDRALTNKTPFTKNKDGKYFYNSSNESIKVKLWNEKEQVVYGTTSAKNRDYKTVKKTIDDWFYLASENFIISTIQEERGEQHSLKASRVKDFINMKLYKETKNELRRSVADDPQMDGNSSKSSLNIIRGYLNIKANKKNGNEITPSELTKIVNALGNKKIHTFYGSVLNKSTNYKSFFASLYKNGLEKALESDASIDFNGCEKQFITQLSIKFPGVAESNDAQVQFEKNIADFITKPKESLSGMLNALSEKNAYAEERKLFFYNLTNIFEKLTTAVDNQTVDKTVNEIFQNLNDSNKEKIKQNIYNEHLNKDVKEKMDKINFSQHESSLIKNIFEETLYNFWLKASPGRVGEYIKDKETKDKKLNEEIVSAVNDWVNDFVNHVILSDDSTSVKQVIVDEYFDLEKSYPNNNISELAQSTLLKNETLNKHYKDTKKVQDLVSGLFEKDGKFECVVESMESFDKNPYVVKRSADFLEREDQLTQWGHISRYFKNEEAKSLIKEANGWFVGYLKKGDMDAYRFTKQDKNKNINHLVDKINEYSTTQHPPFKKLENGGLIYNEAGAGELDVEFWNPTTRKMHGMSITRHRGMEVEGNQFLRHSVKLFSKSLLLQNKDALINAETIKSTAISKEDEQKYLNGKPIEASIRKAICNGDDFAKNLSIVRSFLAEKYNVDYHQNGCYLGKNEMELMTSEMNRLVDFSFFGEVHSKASFPELNAGMNNIGYIRNLKNIGNFELDVEAASLFMNSIDKYYNNISDQKEVNDVAKRVVFNVLSNNNMASNIIDYFSQPNSQKEEREAFVQSFSVFSDFIVENFDVKDSNSLIVGVESFFEDSIKPKEKEQLVEMIQDNKVFKNLENNFKNLETSPDESSERYLLLKKQLENMEKLVQHSNQQEPKNQCKKSVKCNI